MANKDEKIIYLPTSSDGAEGALTDILQAVREDRLTHFAIIAQVVGNGTEDVSASHIPDQDPDTKGKPLTRYYFYGDNMTLLQGMLNRLLHCVNLYTDGIDIFGEDE
jgi:hypothetical protein